MATKDRVVTLIFIFILYEHFVGFRTLKQFRNSIHAIQKSATNDYKDGVQPITCITPWKINIINNNNKCTL